MYGLKSSPKHWADLLSKTLLEAGYTQSDYDSCLYYYKDYKTGKEVYIACYVDDLIVTGDQGYIDSFVRFLQSKFTVRDLGEAKVFVGMEVNRNKIKLLKYPKLLVSKILQKNSDY